MDKHRDRKPTSEYESETIEIKLKLPAGDAAVFLDALAERGPVDAFWPQPRQDNV
jgi:hypothetical protein